MFENTLSLFLMFLKFLIPDVSSSLKYRIRREVSLDLYYWRRLFIFDLLGIHHKGDHNPDRETQDLSQNKVRNPERLSAPAHKAELLAAPERPRGCH